MLDTDKSYIQHRLVKLCQCMDYLNESVFKQAYIELRDAKEVYYANP